MSLSRRVERNTLIQLGGRLYSSALTFAVTALLLPRILDEPAFGVFAFHLTLYQLLANVLDFGAGTIVIREASRERGRAGALIGQLIALKGRIALVALLLLVGVAAWFEEGARLAWLCVAATHVLAHAPSGALAIFAVDMDFASAARAVFLGQTFWLLASLALLAAGSREPAHYLLAFGGGVAAHACSGWWRARRRVAIRYDATRAERAALWRESWPAGVSMAMASTYFYIDAIMLRPLLGEVAVAHYSAAYRLMGFALMLPVLFSQVVFPVFARLWGDGPDALAPVFRRCVRFLGGVGLLVPAILVPCADEVMALVYPAGYGEGAHSLAILSLAIVLVFVTYPHVLALLAAGQQRLMMLVSTGGALLNVGLNLWWVPRIGIEGAAWATVATEGFVLCAAAAGVARRTTLPLRPQGLSRPALVAAGGLALALLLDATLPELPALRVAASAALGALALLASGLLPLDLGAALGGLPETGPPT